MTRSPGLAMKDLPSIHQARETLESPGHSQDYGSVMAGQDWGNGRQAAWLLGLQADDGVEAHQMGEISL